MGYPKKNIILIFCMIIGLMIFFIWGNNSIVVTSYDYRSDRIPKGFHHFKIAHVSDLHNKDFHGKLIKQIVNSSPDIIVITGDLIDRRNTRMDVAIEFIKKLVNVAPIYYVSGNHEHLSGQYESFVEILKTINVNVMDDSSITLTKDGDEIDLLGIADPAFQQSEETYLGEDSSQDIYNRISRLSGISTNVRILLSHRPEYFDIYQTLDMDLVLSGHAHGGQIRIPWIGGVFAPHQGFFPQYTEGIYEEGDTSMVVSRGLGNSLFPLRIFNRPELVILELYTKR